MLHLQDLQKANPRSGNYVQRGSRDNLLMPHPKHRRGAMHQVQSHLISATFLKFNFSLFDSGWNLHIADLQLAASLKAAWTNFNMWWLTPYQIRGNQHRSIYILIWHNPKPDESIKIQAPWSGQKQTQNSFWVLSTKHFWPGEWAEPLKLY